MPRRRPSTAVAFAVALTVAALVGACTGRSPAPRRPQDPRRPTITVASFDFTESEILAELYGQALRTAGYPVQVIDRLGSREIVEPALEQARIGMVVEYTGSALNFLGDRGLRATSDEALTHARLEQAFGARGVSVLAHAPAQDRNGFVVTARTAERFDLRRISDLLPLAARFTIGGPPECQERPLCLPGLGATYALHFGRFEPMPSRAVTAVALDEDEIQVGMIDTTDANLAMHDLVELVDDRRLQPADNLVPVVRTELVARYGPRLVRLVDAISARLTTVEVIELNRKVEVDGQEPPAAAAAWLQAHPPRSA